MKQSWNLLAILLLFVRPSSNFKVGNDRSRPCAIDDNRSVTVHNLKYHCNQMQLRRIFANLPVGTFPPNGKLKGSILIDGLQDQNVWNGKKIKYHGGYRPNESGTLINMLFGSYEMFIGNIYRMKAPIDGKEAFALDYHRDPFLFYIVDYIREVQPNLYLGIMTYRPFNKIPVLYLLLEKQQNDQFTVWPR